MGGLNLRGRIEREQTAMPTKIKRRLLKIPRELESGHNVNVSYIWEKCQTFDRFRLSRTGKKNKK